MNTIQVKPEHNQVKLEHDPDERLEWLEIVRRQVGALHYGVVQIIVHDSQVTQIEKTERVRLGRGQV
jgi:hypothetical protein